MKTWLDPKWVSAFVAQLIALVAVLLVLSPEQTAEVQSRADAVVGAVFLVVANLVFIAGVIYHRLHPETPPEEEVKP